MQHCKTFQNNRISEKYNNNRSIVLDADPESTLHQSVLKMSSLVPHNQVILQSSQEQLKS